LSTLKELREYNEKQFLGDNNEGRGDDSAVFLFAMAPSSRSRIYVNPVNEDDPAEEYFKGRQ
jgi:hypothetical protein